VVGCHGAAGVATADCQAIVCLVVVTWNLAGIMGMKSQHKQKQKERVLAKELAQRMTV
jgi:hypothetical protein